MAPSERLQLRQKVAQDDQLIPVRRHIAPRLQAAGAQQEPPEPEPVCRREANVQFGTYLTVKKGGVLKRINVEAT